jgi:tetratricopeptide (TPR) repeat protein
MVALQNVLDADFVAFVAANCEAYRVGPRVVREASATSARISHIAASMVGRLGMTRYSPAFARPQLSQRQHRASAAGLHWVEIRTGHFARYSNTSMAINRLETLKGMVAQNPTDTFARYGLAMELRNTGDLEGSVAEFRALMKQNPDYSPAYFHGGQTLERLGKLEEAREVYLHGIEATDRTGDQHAKGEMQAALDLL